MSFEPPAGILDIGNATLRVGKLEVAETTGLNQGLQNIVKNDLLITETDSYTTSKSWGLKLPTTWVAEFDLQGQTGKYVEFNFYNEGSTSNAQGYTLNFKDTSLTLKYDNGNNLPITGDTVNSTLSLGDAGYGVATIPTIVGTFRKVNIFFERGVIAVSIDGARVLYHKESDGFNNGLGVASRVVSTTGGAFLNAFIQGDHGGNSIFKNLRIVNGRFISDKTSNVSFIGSLGVGVNTPKESLDIRGNMHLTRVSNVSQISVDSNVVAEYTGPHDRPLRKYPEVALTANSDRGYVTSSSTTVGTYYTWKAFDNNLADDSSVWTTVDNIYDGANDFKYDSNKTLGGVSGEWLKIELPNKIKPSYVRIYPRTYSPPIGNNQSPEDFKILASNDDTNWDELASVVGWVTNATWGKWDISSNTYYKYFAIVCTRTIGAATFGLAELEYYGYEEGSGSLDTTLKSVYNVPATTGTQLEVYYDAKDLTDGAITTVTDLSPNSNDGSVTGATLDTTDGIESFKFNGSSQYITSTHGLSVPGQPVHSQCVWFKITGDTGDYQYISIIGTSNPTNQAGLVLLNDGTTLLGNYYGGDRVITAITQNVWYHAVLVYTGTTTDAAKYYINGVEVITTEAVAAPITPTITGTTLRLGANTSGGQELNGSIANFRLYSKALNADQVKELYDYQKDYFLGSKSQVTLYKGHLGVGVTEPSGQLELAGDERIQEYPPGPMDDYETLIPGHGVFCASASTEFSASFPPYEAFNDSEGWVSKSRYNDTVGQNGVYTGSVSTNGVLGEWLEMKSPYGIKLSGFNLASYPDANSNRQPRNFVLFGSTDGNIWNQMKSVNNLTSGYTYDGIYHTVNSTKYYTYFRVVVSAVQDNTDGLATITRLRYFGTPGPTTLDKGSLSLTRSLDVPRISRYDVDTETPRPEKLVLDFDTTVNSSPTDISGRGNHGTFYGTDMKYSPADKAFVFNGTDDRILGTIPTSSGDNTLSVSLWVKRTSTSGTHCPFFIGDPAQGQGIGMDIYHTGDVYWFIYDGKNFLWNGVTDTWFPENTWTHLVCVHTAGTNFANLNEVYINGVPQSSTATFSGVNDLSLDANDAVTIGSRVNLNYFDGKISNFKLYNVALEPSEVRKLYNLGRTGRSMVISDTAVGIGKAPEAQLDVRGTGKFAGAMTVQGQTRLTDFVALGSGTNSTTRLFVDDPIKVKTWNAFDNNSSDGEYTFEARAITLVHFHFSGGEDINISESYLIACSDTGSPWITDLKNTGYLNRSVGHGSRIVRFWAQSLPSNYNSANFNLRISAIWKYS